MRDVLHLINCGRNSLNLGSTLPWDEVQDWVKQAQVAEQCHQNFLLPDCGRDVTDQLMLHNELHALSMLAKTNPSRLRLLSVRYLVTVRRNMTHTFPYMQFNHLLSYGEIVFQDYQARATFPRLQHSTLAAQPFISACLSFFMTFPTLISSLKVSLPRCQAE